MAEQHLREDIFRILRFLASRNNLTQRDISLHLGISLGKVNYLLKFLLQNNYLKIKCSSGGNHKFKKIRYILTKKGWEEKGSLTLYFLKRKEIEYLELKKEAEVSAAKKEVDYQRL